MISSYNGEVIHTGLMTCDLGMVINGGRDPKMFLRSFPKSPGRLSNILLITLFCHVYTYKLLNFSV